MKLTHQELDVLELLATHARPSLSAIDLLITAQLMLLGLVSGGGIDLSVTADGRNLLVRNGRLRS
jgi:hypothetical protein